MIARARRLSAEEGEAGFTLVELLVAMTLGVVVMGGVMILLIGAMRTQPRIENQSTNVQTARYVLGRLTREIRNGIRIDKTSASSVSFEAYVRHASCGGTTQLGSTAPPTKCEITYSCSGTSCTRLEALPTVTTGTGQTMISGVTNPTSVFTWSPSTSPTYIGLTLKIPDSQGSGALTVSDGASLRNATLGK
jgi:prepilin-type N-terminal cleavage/methylation domain-containing protein